MQWLWLLEAHRTLEGRGLGGFVRVRSGAGVLVPLRSLLSRDDALRGTAGFPMRFPVPFQASRGPDSDMKSTRSPRHP